MIKFIEKYICIYGSKLAHKHFCCTPINVSVNSIKLVIIQPLTQSVTSFLF